MRHKDMIVALAMLGAGVVYMGMSMGVPNRDGVDASTVPTLLAMMMIGLGLIELFAVLRKWWAPLQNTTTVMGDPAEAVAAGHGPIGDAVVAAEHRAETETASRPGSDMMTVGLTLVLIAAYVAALGRIGFPLATPLYLFAQFIVLTPRGIRTPYAVYAVIALAASAVIFATFRYGFGLMLPAGPLTALLP
ncbi:MAG: tripartite tricarboxylate transporter TctB family protein [Paracoccus sp. (in: a-proteobacteria)]|uniref:tripartite tricarboxylate transporter TctB family protein n=1 Tax=Paracoccus sp. TaxID=267 RepID=UPI0026E05368|nr:tripartite tricarboxylate transporter TctB family protein [Paracoccus sp. (in: a-proteobacteria)]MDO5612525.1 tripartite tricarboxylate transporter TctB family protein [Paracoccus sp. (in: a-proteobacteria)]